LPIEADAVDSRLHRTSPPPSQARRPPQGQDGELHSKRPFSLVPLRPGAAPRKHDRIVVESHNNLLGGWVRILGTKRMACQRGTRCRARFSSRSVTLVSGGNVLTERREHAEAFAASLVFSVSEPEGPQQWKWAPGPGSRRIRIFGGIHDHLDFTSQLFFDDTVSDQVVAQGPCNTRGTSLHEQRHGEHLDPRDAARAERRPERRLPGQVRRGAQRDADIEASRAPT